MDIFKNINKYKSKTDKLINDYNENYYNDVLVFLNKSFCCNADAILRIKPKKIKLNLETMMTYNEIIKKYKLKEKFFDIDSFDFDDEHDITEINSIISLLCNNLLRKLGYIMNIYKTTQKTVITFKKID